MDGPDADDQVELGLLQPDDATPCGRPGAHRRALAQRHGVPEDRAAVLRAALTEMARGPARAVMVTLEDLWGEAEQQNTPGTTTQRPNWRRRAGMSLERMQQDDGVVETLRAVDEARRERLPPVG